MSEGLHKDHKIDDDIYRQGIANLAIEGLALSYTQNKLIMQYQAGKISKEELVKKAAEYARS